MWTSDGEIGCEGFTHVTIGCNVCNRVILRMRYKCCVCPDYDLCHACYYCGEHDPRHPFKLLASPISAGVQLRPRKTGGKWQKMKWKLQGIFTRSKSEVHSVGELEDNSLQTDVAHPNFMCDGCGKFIVGISTRRLRCCVCISYDLCEECYIDGKHDADHAFQCFASNVLLGIHLRSRDKAVTTLNAICDGCKEFVSDRRYKCCVCDDYDLCHECYIDGEHDAAHQFRLLDLTTSSWLDLPLRENVYEVIPTPTIGYIICDDCEEAIPTSVRRYKCWLCPDYNLCQACYADSEHDAAHPFKLFDTATSLWLDLPSRENVVATSSAICDGCEQGIPISDRRYQCCVCDDYDLCQECYADSEHEAAHPFKLFDPTTSSWLDLPSRKNGGIYPNVICDGCNTEIFSSDVRYKCCVCYNYDLCPACYNAGEHDSGHPFERFETNTSLGVRLPPRDTGVTTSNIICVGCEEAIPISDRRYKCWICPDYDLCLKCYDDSNHDSAHPFKLFDSTTSSWLDLATRENDADDPGVYCDVCHRDISDMQYLCSICPDYALCYVCYEKGEHDIAHLFKLFDSTTSPGLDLPSRESGAGDPSICCNVCGQDISDMRYKCSICSDYQLCYVCYENGAHDITHLFKLFDSTTSSGLELPSRENDAEQSNNCCNVCRQDISDMRYKCSVCSDYQLCYVCYENGEHDLTHIFKLFDSTTSPGLELPSRENGSERPSICCNVCQQDISDMRYKCSECSDYQLCYVCYENGEHDLAHPFKLFDSTSSPGLDLPLRENDVQYLRIFCNVCGQEITRTRYKCITCLDYDLCTVCYHGGQHDTAHPFYYFDTTISLRVPLRPRENGANATVFCDGCNNWISSRRYKCCMCHEYNLCRQCYRDGKHDPAHRFKRFLSTARLGTDLPPRKNDIKHPFIYCNGCNKGVAGMRYKCTSCCEYYLCLACYYVGEHDRTHRFKLFDSNTSSGLELPARNNGRLCQEIKTPRQRIANNDGRNEDRNSEQNLPIPVDASNDPEEVNQSPTSVDDNKDGDRSEETDSSSRENSAKNKPVIKYRPGECQVCSELSEENVRLEPCNHQPACEECSSKMKRCLQCGVAVEKRVTKDGRVIPVMMGHVSVEQVRHLESKIAEIEECQACTICMDRRRNVVFLCGHSACSECAKSLELCHMCRKTIRKKIPLYN